MIPSFQMTKKVLDRWQSGSEYLKSPNRRSVRVQGSLAACAAAEGASAAVAALIVAYYFAGAFPAASFQRPAAYPVVGSASTVAEFPPTAETVALLRKVLWTQEVAACLQIVVVMAVRRVLVTACRWSAELAYH